MTQIAAELARRAANIGNLSFERRCHGKIRMEREEAESAAKAMHKKLKKPFNAYCCSFCQAYHVGTHRSPSQIARRKNAQ
jgi:hypothetical protein